MLYFLLRAYTESVAATPLIFLLEREVDPLKYVFRFAEENGITGKKLRLVTLGSGQEERARDAIKVCASLVLIHAFIYL